MLLRLIRPVHSQARRILSLNATLLRLFQPADMRRNHPRAKGCSPQSRSFSRPHGYSICRPSTAKLLAAPLSLTSLAANVAALNRSLDRTEGPIVVAGRADAGAVIALARPERVKALVYITALTFDEGEKVADVFYRLEPPQA
jgi:hypothetical protein